MSNKEGPKKPKTTGRKYSWADAAKKLNVEKFELKKKLEKMNVHEYYLDHSCLPFLAQEGYFVASEEYEMNEGYFLQLYFSERGLNAISKFFKKGGKNEN